MNLNIMTIDEVISEEERHIKMNERDIKERFYSSPYIGQKHYCMECINRSRQLVEWLNELKLLREQTRWIPISERLPNHDECIKNNGLFNVSDGHRSYSEWFDVHDKQKFGEPTMAGFRVDNAVTAWMPLPESYKAESEEIRNEHQT